MATRMQQRRGTAAQWISTNSGNGPVLNAGEIGYEIDTNKFKIGDGTNHWVDLNYFTDAAGALAEVTALIDGAPAALNTLNELAAAINDDPAFFTTIATNLSSHEADTTNVHGIADTAALATKTYADGAVTTAVAALTKSSVGLANVDNTSDANKPVSTATQTALDLKADASDLTSHESATQNVHGIADTADLATQDYVLDQIANSTDAYPDLVGDGLAWNPVDETFDVDSTIARVDSVQEGLDLKANIESPTFTGTVSGVTKSMVGLGNVDNTSDADKPISVATQTALDLKAAVAGATFTGDVTIETDLVVDGNLTVNGTNFTASATSIVIEDNLLQLAHENPANTVDLGLVVAYNHNEEGVMHAGIVRDVSESVWKFFKNVEAEPSTTVDFANGELDALKVGGFYATSAVIGSVNDTEIQYLNGVTSSIQDQLDDKLASATAASTYAPINSPTFTGTVAGITKSMVGLNNVDNSADLDKPVSNLTQAALDLKAPLANPTFTGTVSGIDKSMVGLENVDNTADEAKPVSTATQTALNLKANVDGPTLTGVVTLPSSTSIGDVTSTEIGYLEGVTSAIQDQLDNKLESSTASSTYAPIASPTFTGTVAGITKTMVGLANVDDTADTDKPISTDTQAALDLKAPLNAPTFTGTVSGITKAMVDLANVDNTSDANKPISSATQTALDAKLASATAASTYAPIDSPTFTGTVSGVTKAHVGLANVDNTSDANKPVSTAQAAAIATAKSEAIADATSQVNAVIASAPAALNTLDELAAALGDDANFATTVTNSIATKAPLASPTFTGTVTVAASGIAFTDGTQTKAAAPSLVTITSKTADYTLSALTERDSMIEMNSGSATTLTVPPNSSVAYPVGTSIDILRVGAGAVTVAAGAGVTLNYTPGNKLRAQWSSATLVKRATDTWVLLGDLSA